MQHLQAQKGDKKAVKKSAEKAAENQRRKIDLKNNDSAA